MVTEQERETAIKTAPENIKMLYSSKVSTALNKEMISKYNITAENRGVFLDITGDVILGFYKIADLPKLLQKEAGMEKEPAQKLVSELIDMWSPIVEREEKQTNAKKAEVASLADKIESIKPTEPQREFKPLEPNGSGAQTSAMTAPEGAGPISIEENSAVTPEEVSEPAIVKPIRTMSADVEKVHGYGALAKNNNEEEEPVIKATPQDEIKPFGM